MKLTRLHLVEIEVLLLVGLVALCFGCSLTSYFLADDIWQVNYISQIVDGNWQILVRNFLGNFLDIPSSSLYRPLVVVSMVLDFSLWKTNAAGWFATNLLLYAANVLLVLWLAKTLKRPEVDDSWPFLSALLFTVFPLHCEPVCWLAGRSDLICTFWFLLGFVFCAKALLNESKWCKWLSLLSFILGLLSKEMAVIFPAVVSVLTFILLNNDAGKSQRLRGSLIWSSPYWLILVVYFVLRLKFLGTFTGGYTDSLNLVMQSTWLARFCDWKNICRIFYPFRDEFSFFIVGFIALTTAYLVLGTRIYSSKASRESLLLLLWLFFAILPVLSMWGLGPNLEASRIYFLASAPFCMLLGLCLCNVPNKVTRLLCFLCISFMWSLSALEITQVWASAGAEVRKICAAALDLCKSKSGRFAILPLPKERAGALLLTNGGMFLRLLQPPYKSHSFADRFIVFDRIFTEPDYLIDPLRFKETLNQANVSGPYLWKDNNFQLISYKSSVAHPSISKRQVSIRSSSGKTIQTLGTSEKFSISNVPEPQYLELRELSLNPLAADFLQFRINSEENKKMHLAYVSWGMPEFSSVREENGLSFARYASGSDKIVNVPLSSRWKWFATSKISTMRIALPDTERAEVDDIRFVSLSEISPKIKILGARANELGLFHLSNENVNLSVNTTNVKDSRSALLQISRRNFFFGSFSPERQSDAVGFSTVLKSNEENFVITPSVCREKGYYQFRSLALDKEGNPIGVWSNYVTVYRP